MPFSNKTDFAAMKIKIDTCDWFGCGMSYTVIYQCQLSDVLGYELHHFLMEGEAEFLMSASHSNTAPDKSGSERLSKMTYDKNKQNLA